MLHFPARSHHSVTEIKCIILGIFLSLILQSCASNPANSELSETQSNAENRPAEVRPISYELSPWHSANYRGLDVGKSTEKDMLRVLGTPPPAKNMPRQPTVKGYYYGGLDSLDIRVEKASHIITSIVTRPENLSKDDLIRQFGNDYILLTYGMDPCFIDGQPRPPYVFSFEQSVNSTNNRSVQMEYRDLGLSVTFRYENEVYEITYVSDKWPIGTTTSMCDQPRKGLSFIACGCGCCGGMTTHIKKCIYSSKGDDIKKWVEEDKKWTGSVCATVGCSPGIKYIYCD